MRNLTKWVSIILAISIISLSGITISAKMDIENGENIDDLLSVLMVSSEKIHTKSDKTITRGEFAEVLCKMVRFDMKDKNISASFNDVPQGHKYASSIAVMSNMGILNGDGTGAFRPENNIKFDEAAAALVRLLGYEPSVEDKTMQGYFLKATRLDIVRNISGLAADDNLPSGVLCVMIYNAMQTPVMEAKTYGDTAEYEVNPNKTLLTEHFNMYVRTGVVTATSLTALSAVAPVAGKSSVQIDNEIYVAGSSSAERYLGQRVKFYYIAEGKNREKTIALIAKVYSKVVEFQADDAEYSNNVYSVSNDDSKKIDKYKLNLNNSIIYNGKVVGTLLDDSIMIPDDGKIRLVDTEADGTYDVIFITSYETLLVQTKDIQTGVIFDKLDSSHQLEIDLVNPNLTITDKEGYVLKFEDIAEWNTVFAEISNDNEIVNLIVSQEFVNGEINEKISGEDDGIKIDGKLYEYGEMLPQSEIDKLQCGDIGSFYLDIYDKISAVRLVVKTDTNMGYLMNAAYTQRLSEETFEIRVLNSKNEFVNLTAKMPIKIDGKSYRKVDLAYQAITKNSEGNVKRQPITYDVDQDGNLKFIDQPYIDTPSDGESADSLNMFCDTKEPVVYKTSTRAMHAKILLNEDTVVFLVPQDENAPEKEFVATNISYFGNDGWQRAIGYSIVQDYTYANILVTVNNGPQIDMAKGMFMVSEVVSVLDEEGDQEYGLCCYRESAEKMYRFKEQDLLKDLDLEMGDLVFLNFDTNGKIDAIKQAYDVSDDRFFFPSNPEPSGIGGGYRVLLGHVYDRIGNLIKVTTKDMDLPIAQLDMEIYDSGKFTVFVYNEELKTITATRGSEYMKSYKDAGTDASKIVVYTNWGDPRTMFIYE